MNSAGAFIVDVPDAGGGGKAVFKANPDFLVKKIITIVLVLLLFSIYENRFNR